jgi:tetratricopeptide (TPR) repeat protein
LKRRLVLDPENNAYIDSLGWAYYKNGFYQKALKTLQQAVQMLPNEPAVRKHLAEVYFALGEYEKAIDEIDVVLDMLKKGRERG